MQRIFVGDVQGCSEELAELVARAIHEFGDEFVLWIVGDLVNRGPDNRKPLDLIRGLVEAGRAVYVLGNHEISLLRVHYGLREIEQNDTFGDVLSASDAAEWVDWLRSRPLVAPGEIEGQRFAMVHAAAAPDWSFEDLVETGDRVRERLSASHEEARALLGADPGSDPVCDALARLTRCRSIAADGAWSSREPEKPERAWHRVWAKRSHDYGLVYGHWARQGLHLDNGLRGLDTGCVHHGRGGRVGFLTAWLPDSSPSAARGRPFELPDDRFWQIPARRRYDDPVTRGGQP